MHIRIRAATADDAHELASIHVAGWRWAYRGLMPDALLASLSIEVRHAMWTKLLADPPPRTAIHIADGDDEALGFVWCGVARDADLSNAGEIFAIYLRHEATAGTGVGRRLMEAA